MESTAEDDDLYSDLLNTSRASGASKASVAKKQDQNVPAVPSLDVQNLLEKKVQDLAEENETLKRNIGTLYRTAKAEIKRKDEEIARLLHENEELKKR